MRDQSIRLCLLITFSTFTFLVSPAESNINVDEASNDPLKAWSLPDATAFADQAFVYTLPDDFEQYEVSELELNFLPEWLEYDGVHKRLVGVAGQDDIGKLYFMEVKPAKHLWHSSASPPIDIFRIEVENPNKEEFLLSHRMVVVHGEGHRDAHQSNPARAIHCKSTKPATRTSIVVDLDYDDNVSPCHKVLMLQRFSGHYDIPLNAVKYLSHKDPTSQGTSVLVAGPGDHKADKAAVKKNNVVLQWTVGCGSVHKYHLSVLQRLEEEAKDGILRKVLQRSVLGWFVTNNRPNEDKRKKRYLQNHYYPTATATVAILPPSSTHSGEDTTSPDFHKSTKAPKTSKGRQHKTKRPPQPWSDADLFEAVKSLSVIQVFVGEVFRLKVDKHLFSRPFKHLQLTTLGGLPLSTSSWIKLNSSNLLYGIPLWHHQGVQKYVLKAWDAQGNEADLKLDFNVVPALLERAPFEMSIIIQGLDYERFVDEVDVRVALAGRLASAFGDDDMSEVLMMQVARGSVDYSWTNKSMLLKTVASKHRGCSVSAVRGIFDRFINASTAHLDESFSRAMEAYNVTYAEAHPSGDCEKLTRGRVAHFIRGQRVPKRERQRFHSTSLSSHEFTPNPLEEESRAGRVQNMDELFKQVLVPSLIVVALVLLALLIACMAFSMRSNKKEEKLHGADDYIRKGTPVIFAHELDDQPSTLPSKRPLITSTQRSPRPPNYRQHMISATSSAANLPSTSKLYVAN